ncbi:MAG: response regulator [Deltaproteobacteria bacterium]|nr:response regulator [Deltaproteobacteria bacterium]
MKDRAAVLVVDDDALVLELLNETLSPQFDVAIASSGNEALSLLMQREFAVLLADQRMPGMTGVALAAKAREICPHIVTVLLSAYADPKDFIAAINHGQVFRFISKPWEHHDLVLTLHQAVQRSQLSRDNLYLVAEREQRLHALEILQAVVAAGARGSTYYPARVLLTRLHDVVNFDLAAILVTSKNRAPTLELTSTVAVNERNVLELRDQTLALFEYAGGPLLDEARLLPASSCQINEVEYALIESQAQVALQLGGRTVGIMVLQSFKSEAFADDVTQLLDSVANGAAEVLHQIHDVTEHRLHRVLNAIESLTEGIIILDDDGTVQLANQSAQRMLTTAGITAEALWQNFGNSPLAMFTNVGQRSHEVTYGSRTLQVQAASIANVSNGSNSNTSNGFVLIIRDLTTEKERETQRLRFISTVSHEIRTPLSTIAATFDLLLHEAAGALSDKQREYLISAAQAGETLHAVVDDLLEIEKYAAGGMVLKRNLTNIGELIQKVAARFAAAATESELTIDIKSIDSQLELEVDTIRIEQVLSNLLSNAVKYAHSGTSITIEMGKSSAPENSIIIGVHNIADSISPQDLTSIFDRFGTMPPLRPGRHSSGLGLAICRRIIDAHAGLITVESNDNHTSFWIALPIQPQAATTAIELLQPLFVHADNSYNRIALMAELSRCGLPVQLLPPVLAKADHLDIENTSGNIVITTSGKILGNAVLKLEHYSRSDVQVIGDTLFNIARFGAPRLIFSAKPEQKVIETALNALGVQMVIDNNADYARELPTGNPMDILEMLASDVSGSAGVAAIRAFLRRSRAKKVQAGLAILLNNWDGFIAAYGASRAADLLASMLPEITRMVNGENSDTEHETAAIITLSHGFLCCGEQTILEHARDELVARFETLVRLYCRKEDRERGYIALGSRQLALPTITTKVLLLTENDNEFLSILRVTQ